MRMKWGSPFLSSFLNERNILISHQAPVIVVCMAPAADVPPVKAKVLPGRP